MQFKEWILRNFPEIQEMATLNFGKKHKGKHHTKVPSNYLQWMQDQMASGKGNFNVSDDNGMRMDKSQLSGFLGDYLSNPEVAKQVQQAKASRLPPEGMAQNPKPNGWIGPFSSKRDDPDGRFQKGDMIYWDKKSGSTMPAFAKEGETQDAPPQQQVQAGNKPSPDQVRLPPEHMNPYNTAIQNKFLNTNENMMIDALAGTGKTTILKHLASFIKPGEKWLYLVFNSKNRDEATQEFPVLKDENGNVTSSVTIMTTHGFLGNLLKGGGVDAGGNTNLPRDGQEDKIKIIADRMTEREWPKTSFEISNKKGVKRSPFHGKAKFKAIHVASLAKAFAVDPRSPSIQSDIMEIVQKYNIDMDCSLSYVPQGFDKQAGEVVRNLPDDMVKKMTQDIVGKSIEYLQSTLPNSVSLEKMGWLNNMRDQDDTLWYTAIYADQMNWNTGYDVVLMDEVQDFNMCQIAMSRKLKEAGHRIIAVGDPNQSMYRFRGASSESFGILKQEIGQGQSENLPINYRSDGNIIDWVAQNTHVNDIQSDPSKQGQGEVWADGGTHPPIGYKDFLGTAIEEMNSGGQLNHSTAMIARNNAPLAVSAIELLKSGVNFEIVGLDLSKELLNQIDSVFNESKDEDGKPLYSKWVKMKYGKRKLVHDYESVPIQSFMGKALNDHFTKYQSLWQSSASKQDKLKMMRSAVSILGYIWEHIQNPQSMDEDAKSIADGNVRDLVGYLKSKLGGKDTEKKEDMDALSQRDPKSYVGLTTAHKAKGLEWERVFLLKPNAYNPEENKNIRTEDDAQQEKNAWYVAATRPKNVLMVSADNHPLTGAEEEPDPSDELSMMCKMMYKG